MAQKTDIVAILLSKANFDLSQFSPELRDFIYAEVAEDRLPLGAIIKRAQSNENDLAALQIELDRVKGTLPEVIQSLPMEFRMFLQPIINMIKE